MSNGQGIVARKLEAEKWGLQDVLEVRHIVRQMLPERRIFEEYAGKGGKLPVADGEIVGKWILDDVEAFKAAAEKAASPLAKLSLIHI